MAEIIPALDKRARSCMTAGERAVADCLQKLLEDDYWIWCEIPLGKSRRYPDFVILHAARGLLFLEVKDWKVENIRNINPQRVELLTDSGMIPKENPLVQARKCGFSAIDSLKRDPQLRQASGKHQGNLIFPYAFGTVFTNITRKKMQKAIPDAPREKILPDHLTLYKDDIGGNTDAETLQTKLWNMFEYQFGDKLSLPQIDRIRWHLFPEIRIGAQKNVFASADAKTQLPEVIRIMDKSQEQLARNLGSGHRVIHGVAGSGKTLLLGFRCRHLAQVMNKPILVLCYNVSLAACLRKMIDAENIGDQVQIYHFHEWCKKQLQTYHVPFKKFGDDVWKHWAETVIREVERGMIPRAQYGALLIDEAHDFEAEWLKLVVQMVAEDDPLLLLYDDAQAIYKKDAGLGFSLSSVGINARGRTTILRLNYRNTREILHFAYEFTRRYIDPKDADDDHIPVLQPHAGGASGPTPTVKLEKSYAYETRCAIEQLRAWHAEGVAWKDMALIHVGYKPAQKLFANAKIPALHFSDRANKAAYDPTADRVTVSTLHSSKGLEFERVVLIGVGNLPDEKDQADNARLLYVGMTRARRDLFITTSKQNQFSRELLAMAA